MTGKTLSDISDAMRKIDFCMLTTRSEGGELASRPMSNNGDVRYEGDSFFFSYDDARSVTDIRHDPKVGVSFAGGKGVFGRPPIFIHVEGHAELIQDRQAFKAHWVPDLERWFKDGIDTPGLTLIRVRARRVHYWDGEDEGEVKV